MSRIVEVGRVRTHILEAGHGEAVVLLHGLGGLAQEVLAPLLFLAGTYRIIAVDRPGYGASEPLPEREMAPHRQSRWLAALLDALRVERPVLIAHSLAAATALCYADSRPDSLSGLVLISPFCRPTMPDAMPLLRIASARVLGWPVRKYVIPAVAPLMKRKRLASIFRPDKVPAYMGSLPVRTAVSPDAILAMAAELRGYNRSMIPLALRLRRLQVRTIVVSGDCDTVAPWARHAGWLARRLPNVSAACLSKTGHMGHHARPAFIAAAVESARLGQGKSAPAML